MIIRIKSCKHCPAFGMDIWVENGIKYNQFFCMIIDGKYNKEIGDKLYLTDKLVEAKMYSENSDPNDYNSWIPDSEEYDYDKLVVDIPNGCLFKTMHMEVNCGELEKSISELRNNVFTIQKDFGYLVTERL